MAEQRGKIELASGSIQPVKRGLWHAASEKLGEAHVGVMQMKRARNQVAYEEGWTRFVDSLEEFWTRFYSEGKESFSSFPPWTGYVVKSRKDDALLQYLCQARHQSQHGRIALEWVGGGSIMIGGPEFSGHIGNLEIWNDGSYKVEATPATGSQSPFQLLQTAPEPTLPTVINKKFGQSFPPPAEHLGKPIEGLSPISASELGLDFYNGVLKQGFEKFAPQQ